ncbi:MAG: PQQ-dependent sugar dehydrogenase [Actinomycetes bacterium]
MRTERLTRGILAASLLVGLALPAAAADTVGTVNTNEGHWTLRADNGNTTTFAYGRPGDIPFMGDWNGDGIDTAGLYRQSDGFVYIRDSNAPGNADRSFYFGRTGDIPVVGDFDGDDRDTVSVYRPSTGTFYIKNELEDGWADYEFVYGRPGDVPFAGDWDRDGVDTVGLRRPSDGFVYLRNSNSAGWADVSFFYGRNGDVVIVGDWDGDGDDTLGVYRPSNGMVYLRNSLSSGNAHVQFQLGDSPSVAVAGSFGLSLPAPPPPLRLQRLTPTFTRPVLVTAPTGDDRLFVVEQDGDIEIVKDGAHTGRFLRLSVTSGGERGLLGLAFHPDYASNGKFYVNYTIGSETRISEFRVSATPDVADPGSERILLRITQPYSNHNGGMLLFDQDGYLLIALGDGGSAGDPGNRAQNPSNLLGKILRIDVDRTSSGRQYAIPSDNPYAGGGGAPEVWIRGVRNPWRIAYDRGNLFVADVGQGQREEVTVLPRDLQRGANLGWRTWEGTHCHAGPCSTSGFAFPQVEYTHSEGCSITGGFVYRGMEIPGLQGTYFFGDFCGGWIRSFRFENGVASPVKWQTDLGTVPQLSSFGQDGKGELYVTSLDGRVWKIVR